MNVRSMTMSGAIILLAPADVLAQETPAPPTTVARWMDRHFRDIAASCGVEVRQDRSYIPPDVRNWPSIRDMWDNQSIETSGIQSLDARFARVTRWDGTRYNPVGTQIGFPWADPRPPIVYRLQSNAVLEQNCVTLLAAQGQAGLNFSFVVGNLGTNLRTSITSSTSLSSFFYQGTVVSPAAVALGDDDVPIPTAFPRFGVLAAIWSWYRNNADFIAPGSAGELYVLRRMEALAAYRAQGLTQSRLLQAQASANISYLIFNASGGANYDQRDSFRNASNIYSIAYWNPQQLRVPTPAEIALQASRASVDKVTVVTINPEPIDDSEPFEFEWDVLELPSSLCTSAIWSPSTATSADQAVLSNLRLSPAADRCRFRATATPPTEAGTGVNVVLAVRASLPTGGNATDLALTSAPVRIPDYRSAIGLDRVDGPGELQLTRPPVIARLPLTYDVRERQPSRQVTSARWLASPRLACGGGAGIALAQPPIQVNRTGEAAILLFSFEVPATIVGGQPRASCQITGRVRLVVNNTASVVDTDLPIFSFQAVAAPSQ